MRVLIRAATAAFCAVSASYALLCASSFTFHDFIRPGIFGVSSFAAWHARLYWLWLAIAVVDIRGASRRRGQWLTFAAVWTVVGLYMSVWPVMPALANDRGSILVALCSLLPLLWIAISEHRLHIGRLPAQSTTPTDVDRAEGRLLIAAVGAAVFIAVAAAMSVPIVMRGQFEPDLQNAGLSLGLIWTLVAAAVIFCSAFVVLASAARIVRTWPVAWQYLLLAGVAAAAAAVGVDRALSQTLGFVGPPRMAIDVMVGVTVLAAWGAQQLRRLGASTAEITSPLDVLFGAGSRPAANARVVLSLAAIAAAAYAVMIATRIVDWDFTVLETATALLWVATFVLLYRAAPRRAFGGRTVALICLAPLIFSVAAAASEQTRPSIRRILNRYTVYNASLRLGEVVLQRSTATISPIQRYLRDSTALTGLDIKPVALDFVAPLAPVAHPPNVFVFVIDSLRSDYLSPYNHSVTFTPRIAQFAAESIVFRNTVTRYGATGLSLPAIWTGAVGVHRQYVMPFAPMNTLEKFLTVNRYRRIMSIDSLMERLLLPWSDTIQLDRGVRHARFELCSTLNELEARFPPVDATTPPLFGYSNPQNLHLDNIVTASVPAGEHYEGFHAPYAARVHAVDACFGTFIDFLKARRLYEQSVVVLTADHGELLGEEGRWGHAYYLFPPVPQVPLIVHLPAGAAGHDSVDVGAVSFSTDIAPTIYAAAGYSPRPANALMGESLIGPTRADSLTRRRGDYVVEASYSSVYGVVRKNGRRVYIIDAVTGAEYAYDRRRSGGWTAIPVVDAIRVPAQRIIREHVDEVRRVYHMPPLK